MMPDSEGMDNIGEAPDEDRQPGLRSAPDDDGTLASWLFTGEIRICRGHSSSVGRAADNSSVVVERSWTHRTPARALLQDWHWAAARCSCAH